MAVVLDARALIAVERSDASVGAVLRLVQQNRKPVRTRGAAAAQVWRPRSIQAQLARVLAGIEVMVLDESAGRSIGELLRRSGTGDVVDGHVTLIVRSGDTVLTSDAGDIGSMLEEPRVSATVHAI
jgi:hypothetical protein